MKTKRTTLAIILLSTFILTACGSEEIPPSTEQPSPTITEPTVGVTGVENNNTNENNEDTDQEDNTSPDTANATSNSDLAETETETISGTVETIGNGQFEIWPLTVIPIEEEDVELTMQDPDTPWLTIAIDENTRIETILSDGENHLDRWDSILEDIEINNSVMVTGTHIGDQFLAIEIIIFSWTFM